MEIESHQKAHRYGEASAKLSTLHILLSVERERHLSETQQLKTVLAESLLSNAALQLIAQTELLANFRDDIRTLVRKLPPTDPVIRELKEKLKALPCESIDWERFDAQFRAAHPEFTKKLAERYPELSAAELRVCSLLRMNMKSVDIARLFCTLSEPSRAIVFRSGRRLACRRGRTLRCS
jgi:hypothetical protein